MSRKYSLEEVRDIFKQRDCVLLAETYENSKKKLPFVCSCGNHSEINLNHLLNGRKCSSCGRKRNVEKQRHTIGFVRDYFEKHDCILLSNFYENNKTELNYICKCGNTHVTTFDTFKKSHRCRECWKNSLRGQTNPNYNPTLTDDEREYKRVSVQYTQWRNNVFTRDKFCCAKCGISGVFLQAHHLDGFHWCTEKRYDLNNGATLCVTCHDNFHAVNGRHNNTKTQFDEWMRRRNDKIV
jgi:hypothetical protein